MEENRRNDVEKKGEWKKCRRERGKQDARAGKYRRKGERIGGGR